MPILSQLFADNDVNIRQSDIVMLLTPHIVRTHELNARDLGNIYIGTQTNMSLGGPPPLIGGIPEVAPDVPAATPPPAPPATPTIPGPGGVQLQPPPGTSPIPGLTPVPTPAPTPPVPAPGTPAPAPIATPPPAPVTPPVVTTPGLPPGVTVPPITPPIAVPPATPSPAAPPPATVTPGNAAPTTPAATAAPATPPATPARVLLSTPAEMRVGAGPYTVPVSITGASRLTTITISINYNPAVVRVRNVQEGSFMRQGGISAPFTQQVDPAAGRIDIAVTRPGDQVGASGTGLLAAILFEPAGAGSVTFTMSGVGALAGGGTAPLTFTPATVVVK
jgi:hypothetical protein